MGSSWVEYRQKGREKSKLTAGVGVTKIAHRCGEAGFGGKDAVLKQPVLINSLCSKV